MTRKLIILLLLVLSAAAQNKASAAGTFLDVGGVKLWYQQSGRRSEEINPDGAVHQYQTRFLRDALRSPFQTPVP
jgi:hypothetical protein